MEVSKYNQMMAYLTRPRDKFRNGGRIGFDNGGSPRTITNQYGTFKVKGDDRRFTKSTVAKPKDGITFSEFRTRAATQPNFLKEVIKKLNPNKSYTAKDLFNLLGITTEKGNPKAIEYFTGELKKAGIKSTANPTGGRGKQYKLKDVIKFFKENPKTTKLGKTSKEVADVRLGAEERLDKDLYDFNTRVTKNVRETAKAENVYLPKNLIGASAGDHIGHPVSLKITDKPEFKNLLKDSNVNKMNSLVFQDAVVNMESLNRNTGYDTKFNTYFKQLNKFLNKPITNKNRQELINIKNDMDNHYNKVINKINETTKKNKFFKGQEKRIPKVTIDIPEVGSKFKSSNLFADMSTVDPEYRYGKVQKINPNAKFFKDLTSDQKQIFKQNIYNQYSDNLNSFYKQANLPTKDVEEFSQFIEAGGVKETVGKKDILGVKETVGKKDILNQKRAVPMSLGATGDIEMAKNIIKKDAATVKNLLSKGSTGLDRYLLRPLTAIEAPTLAIPQSAYAAYELAGDVKRGEQTDVGATDITLPTSLSSLAASKKFGLDLFADNAGRVKKFLRGPFTQQGIRALSRGSVFATPIIEAAIQGYNARQRLLKAREKYGTDDMVPTGLGMAPREYVRDLAIENQKFEGEGLSPFQAAGGGIAKLAGVDSGPPPSKGPTSQGLDFLMKRGRQY